MTGSVDSKVDAITRFHRDILNIHPFLDGNGRIARFLLNQQAGELLDIKRRIVIEDRAGYYSALKEAQHGNMMQLFLLIKQAIFGEE